eukprot:scaffold23739_cov41-Prasinocladus_malaysianus.AAC.2
MSWPKRRHDAPASTIAPPGTKNAHRQARNGSVDVLIAVKMRGISSCVTPPPRLPHPPAVALARPTIFGVNIMEHQNWVATKVDRLSPTNSRPMMNPRPFRMMAKQNRQGAHRSCRMACP